MIQEIYDYLLTRAFFLNVSEEEIVETIDSKETFDSIIERVSNLMQQEDFFLTNEEYQEKLWTILEKYRFKYNSSEINDDINYIILRLNQYKSMTPERKNHLINEFYKNEYAIRNLPKAYQLPYNIDNFMKSDFGYLTMLFPLPGEGSEDGKLEINNIVEFLGLMNMLLNKNSEIFLQEGFCDNTINNLNTLLSVPKLPLYYLMYIKKTLKNFKNLAKGKYKVITI